MKKINQYDSNNNKTGYWEVYYPDGNLSYKGDYLNGKRTGYWEEYYHSIGKLSSKGNFINDKQTGYWEWYYNGKLISKEFYI